MAIAALFVCTSVALSVLGYRWWGGFMLGIPIEDFPKLADRIKAAEAQNAKLKEALREAAGWFEDYAFLHKQKNTQDGDVKASVNQTKAKLLRAVLAETEGNGK